MNCAGCDTEAQNWKPNTKLEEKFELTYKFTLNQQLAQTSCYVVGSTFYSKALLSNNFLCAGLIISVSSIPFNSPYFVTNALKPLPFLKRQLYINN